MKTRSKIRIPMPARYVINLALVVGFYFLLTGLISSGIITNYWTGILITVGINIILAVSLNIATGYLGQLPLGHAGFMAVGAYAGGIFMKATPAAALLKEGNTAALIPYILAAIVISAVVAGIFGVIIGIPALRLRGDYLAIITLGFGEIIRVVLTNIDSVLGFDFTYGAAGLKRIPKFASVTLVFICVVLACFFIHTMMKSKHGRAILSIRDNEIASESVGVNTTYYKTMAFVFSAMLAGICRLPVRRLSWFSVSLDVQIYEIHRDPRHRCAWRHGLDAGLDRLGDGSDGAAGAASLGGGLPHGRVFAGAGRHDDLPPEGTIRQLRFLDVPGT